MLGPSTRTTWAKAGTASARPTASVWVFMAVKLSHWPATNLRAQQVVTPLQHDDSPRAPHCPPSSRSRLNATRAALSADVSSHGFCLETMRGGVPEGHRSRGLRAVGRERIAVQGHGGLGRVDEPDGVTVEPPRCLLHPRVARPARAVVDRAETSRSEALIALVGAGAARGDHLVAVVVATVEEAVFLAARAGALRVGWCRASGIGRSPCAAGRTSRRREVGRTTGRRQRLSPKGNRRQRASRRGRYNRTSRTSPRTTAS